MRLLVGLLASSAIAVFVAACGDDRSGPRASGPDVDAAVPPPAGDAGADSPDAVDADVDGLRFEAQVALRSAPLPSGGVLLLLERPLALRTEWGSPQREVHWLDAQGRTVRRYAAPDQRELVDVTLHPSGEVTVLLASKDGYVLHRLSAQGLLLGQTTLADAAVATDPPALTPGESTSPIEAVTHDAARLAAVGADVVLGARTGRHSVVAYRVAFDEGPGAFAVRWRTMVEPAMEILPIGLTGGTYDTFGQLEGQHSVHVGVDGEERVYVAIRHPHGLGLEYVEAHDEVFGEKLVTDPDGMDLFVTRLTSQGVRLGTSVVGTPQEDELYGLRVFEDAAYVVGRTEHWNERGTGWDALIGRVDAVTGAATVRELDVDRSDIAFDVARAADGSVVVVGASGYWQNPHGASISEECNTFVRWLRSDGIVVPVMLPNGPRHSEARAIASLGGDRFIVTGMLDGPGTHTADGDLALLRARGFLVERALPGP